jgi:hypothetical protein
MALARASVLPTAWPKFIIHTGFGLYYDRGEFFTNFSPSAGGGFNGPFGVTLQPPFVQPVQATASGTSQNPFGAIAPPIDTNPSDFIKNLPNQTALKKRNRSLSLRSVRSQQQIALLRELQP